MEQNPPAIASQPPDEETHVDRAIELRAMANMLRRAEGFTLAFAQCNQPVERHKLVSELREILGDCPIAEIEFAKPIEHLLDELIPLLDEYKDARALFIYGLEHSIHSDREFSPLVANLNLSRNSFPLHISCSMILWLPAYATTAVLRGAPDFFSWRSSLFQFLSPPTQLAPISQDALSDDVLSVINLTLEEKQERIAVIKSLLADYESLPADKRDRRTESRLFHRLGNLHHSLGNYRQAGEYCEQSLKISEELSHKIGIAASLHQLGMIAQERGDYHQAGEHYKQSSTILEELGDKSGITISLHQLGNIAYSRGDYAQAGEYYKQSLTILEELGDKSGIASSLAQFGMLYKHRGDTRAAIRLLAVARDIFAQVGSPNQEKASSVLTLLQAEVEQDDFEALVKEAQADPERVIREVLDSRHSG